MRRPHYHHPRLYFPILSAKGKKGSGESEGNDDRDEDDENGGNDGNGESEYNEERRKKARMTYPEGHFKTLPYDVLLEIGSYFGTAEDFESFRVSHKDVLLAYERFGSSKFFNVKNFATRTSSLKALAEMKGKKLPPKKYVSEITVLADQVDTVSIFKVFPNVTRITVIFTRKTCKKVDSVLYSLLSLSGKNKLESVILHNALRIGVRGTRMLSGVRMVDFGPSVSLTQKQMSMLVGIKKLVCASVDLEGLGYIKGIELLRAAKCDNAIDADLRLLAGVKVLVLGRCNDITDTGISYLKGIKHLEIGAPKVTDVGLKDLKGVRYLKLDSDLITDDGLSALSETIYLNLPRATDITNDGLASLTSVKRLILPNASEISDEGLVHLPEVEELQLPRVTLTEFGLRYLRKIRKLSVWITTNEGLAQLGKSSRFEVLTIDIWNWISVDGFKHLKNLKSLQINTKSDCITDDVLSKLPNLKVLTLHDNRTITWRGLAQLTELTELRMIQNPNDFRKALPYLKSLRVLKLDADTSIRNDDLKNIPNVLVLHLPRNRNITREGVRHLKKIYLLHFYNMDKKLTAKLLREIPTIVLIIRRPELNEINNPDVWRVRSPLFGFNLRDGAFEKEIIL